MWEWLYLLTKTMKWPWNYFTCPKRKFIQNSQPIYTKNFDRANRFGDEKGWTKNSYSFATRKENIFIKCRWTFLFLSTTHHWMALFFEAIQANEEQRFQMSTPKLWNIVMEDHLHFFHFHRRSSLHIGVPLIDLDTLLLWRHT
jgi:hypothetical protein